MKLKTILIGTISTIILFNIIVFSFLPEDSEKPSITGNIISDEVLEENNSQENTSEQKPNTSKPKESSKDKKKSDDKDKELEQTPNPTPEPPPTETPEITPDTTPTNIKIANWNLQIFGTTKASKPDLLNTYASIIDDYDIIFIQEIRNKDQLAFPNLCRLLPDYDCRVSDRAGRSSSKEQYGVIYKRDIEIIEFRDFTSGHQDKWERPPIRASFRIDDYEVMIYNIHTRPDDVENEMFELEKLVMTPNFRVSDNNVIVLGDLNADCSYYDNPSEPDFEDNWNWIIKDNEDTTVKSTDCAYDRIILNDNAYEEYKDDGIYTTEITEDVSDHYLVWVEVEI